MAYMQIVLSGITLVGYCLINATVLSALFHLVQPTISYGRSWLYFVIQSFVSMGIIFGFFALVMQMFCWTAWLGKCLQCICPGISIEGFMMQNNMPASILFFVGMSAVQMAIIAIPRSLTPLTFVGIVVASNFIASLIKLGIVSLW